MQESLKVVTHLEDDGWVGSEIEDVAGEIGLFCGEAEEEAELTVVLNGKGALAYETEAEPVFWGVGELGPGVEIVR